MELSERLLGLAFEYKKQKLWKKLYESDLFAVRMKDGSVGYVSILGNMGEHNALVLYLGDAGYQCLRSLTELELDFENMDEMEFRELALQNNCIQCALDSKDALFEDELEETRAYARAHGIRIAGKNAYPHFVRFYPGCMPWRVMDEAEQEYLAEALEAALALSEILESGKRNIELADWALLQTGGLMPFFEFDGEKWRLGTGAQPVPEVFEPAYPTPMVTDELLMARLRKLRKNGRLQCDLMAFPDPVQEGDEAPFFPYFLMALNPVSEVLLPTKHSDHPERGAGKILENFARTLLEQTFCPREIHVKNDRTEQFLKGFCGSLKIHLERKPALPALEDVELDFLHRIREPEGDEIGFLIEFLSNLSDEELLDMPPVLQEQVADLIAQGILPLDLALRLLDLLELDID